MSTQREVLQQALEAFHSTNLHMHVAAIDAIRAALAEQKCPCGDRPAEQCLGEWEPGCDMGSNPKYAKVAEHTPQQKVQEPVAWAYQWKQGNPISWYVTVARWPESDIWHEYPLYTAPQQAEPTSKASLHVEPVQEPVADIGSEWTPCVKLPITVHVREQRQGETHVSTREGITPVRPDDLIMRGVAGEEYPIGRELFNRTYRLGAEPVQKPKRTVTYACPVCAASLEKQE